MNAREIDEVTRREVIGVTRKKVNCRKVGNFRDL